MGAHRNEILCKKIIIIIIYTKAAKTNVQPRLIQDSHVTKQFSDANRLIAWVVAESGSTAGASLRGFSSLILHHYLRSLLGSFSALDKIFISVTVFGVVGRARRTCTYRSQHTVAPSRAANQPANQPHAAALVEPH